MTELDYEEAAGLADPVFIDVRAPVEFDEDHIPGAVNMPIFDNYEREEIGRIYKILGRDDAVIRGSELAGLKIGEIVANIKKISGRDIVIYCFRGGMRSTSLISLLESLEFRVFKLRDGYKGYRRHVCRRIENIEIRPRMFVLHGLTGTGKTEIIRKMENTIDLERLAGHRSSVFGALGLKQNTQKMFESLLLVRIDELNRSEYIVAEGESRKIGDLHIPERLLRLMYSSPGILIEAPIERRVDIILSEYGGNPDGDAVASIVESISGRLGRKNAAHLIELFERGDIREFISLLLLKYYDPLYAHTLDKMDFIARVENADSARAAGEIEAIIAEYRKAGTQG